MTRTSGHKPYSITFKSFITGHHVYKEVWSPVLGEDLTCLPEPENSHDKYAIQVLKNKIVVVHVPREISRYCCYALNSGGKIKATVCGRRENKRVNVLEVPYNYLLKGPDKYLGKAECAIKDIVGEKRSSYEKYPS